MFPAYLQDPRIFTAFWPMALAVLVTATLFATIFCARSDGAPRGAVFALPDRISYLTAVAFSALGIVTGYVMGLSREPAVQAVVPAILSLVAGMAVFLMGRDTTNRLSVGLSILCLSTNLLVGAIWGAEQRVVIERNQQSYNFLAYRAHIEAKLAKEKLKYESELESYRRELGLDE